MTRSAHFWKSRTSIKTSQYMFKAFKSIRGGFACRPLLIHFSKMFKHSRHLCITTSFLATSHAMAVSCVASYSWCRTKTPRSMLSFRKYSCESPHIASKSSGLARAFLFVL